MLVNADYTGAAKDPASLSGVSTGFVLNIFASKTHPIWTLLFHFALPHMPHGKRRTIWDQAVVNKRPIYCYH